MGDLPFLGEGVQNHELWLALQGILKRLELSVVTASGGTMTFDWDGANVLIYVNGVLVKTL